MTDSTPPTAARRYLLGSMSPAEMKDFEGRYFADDDRLAELLCAEDDLLDELARGELDGVARGAVEARLAAHPRGRARAAFARTLARYRPSPAVHAGVLAAAAQIHLRLGMLRSRAAAPSFALADDLASVALAVELEPGEPFARYRLALRGRSGVEAWHSQDLTTAEDGVTLSATLPRNRLREGPFEIEVMGLGDDEGATPLGFCYFSVAGTTPSS